jgi:hypothetical protein
MDPEVQMKKQWIDGILEKYHRLNEACDDVIDVGAMDIEGPLYKAIWGAWEHLLEQCDHDDWIAWYIHDNDCGERRHRIYPSGSADGIVIDSTEALARFLVEWDRIERAAELQERERYAAALRLHRENNPEAVTGHEECHWAQNEDGWWNTDCGDAFEFTDGSPIYNGFKCCPYCEKKLRETPHAEDDDSLPND